MTLNDEVDQYRLTKKSDPDMRTLTLLADGIRLLIHAQSEQNFLDAICALVREIGGYPMAWVGFIEPGTTNSVSLRAKAGNAVDFYQGARKTWSDEACADNPVGTVIRTGTAMVNRDHRASVSPLSWSALALQQGYRSDIVLPLKGRHGVFGIFAIFSAEAASFNPTDIGVLEELAHYLCYGIEAIRTRAENEAGQAALKNENEKNLTLLRNASDGIHILDAAGHLIEASDAFCDMLGYRHDEMMCMHVTQWDAFFSESDLRQSLQQQFHSRQRAQFETRHRCKDGVIIDVEISGSAVELNGVTVLFNSSRDITLRKQAERELRDNQQKLLKSEAQYQDLIRNVRIAIVVHTPDTRIVFSNPRASELLGLSEDQMRGKVAIDPAWHFVDEQDQRMPLKMYPVNQVIAAMKPIAALVLGVRFPDTARVTWLLVNAFPEVDSDGSLKHIVVNFDDITERKRAEAKIRHLAYFDALTRLPNRRLLMDRFQSALTVSSRSNRYGAILFIDMDRFKTVNDVLGHDFGDLLLIEVANRIRSCVREGDTVARWGGDEFVVLLIEIDEQMELASQITAEIAATLHTSLNQPYLLKSLEQHNSSSIGVALYRGDIYTPDVILRQADIAMYKAKNAGRNTVRFFNPEMQRALELHAALEADLRHAVPEQQLQLYYQLQVDSDQLPMGAEALRRWFAGCIQRAGWCLPSRLFRSPRRVR